MLGEVRARAVGATAAEEEQQEEVPVIVTPAFITKSAELRCASLDPFALFVALVAVCSVVWELPHPTDEVVAAVWVALNTVGFGAQLLWARGDVGLLWTRGAALATSVYVLRGLFTLDEAKADAVTVMRSACALLVQFLPVVYSSQRRLAMEKLAMLKLREEHPTSNELDHDAAGFSFLMMAASEQQQQQREREREQSKRGEA